MLSKITLAVLAAVMFGSACSLAVAQPVHPPVLKPCITDEGGGRIGPCNYGGSGN
jgi:hypothetical protein